MLKTRCTSWMALVPLIAMTLVADYAQAQATTGGPTFDPITQALSDKNPSVPDVANGAPPPLTPEQQEAKDRQDKLADIQAKKAVAKQKMAELDKARKEKQDAAKAAETKKMADMKMAREAQAAQLKTNREQLAALLQEQKDARKAYQEAKKDATGSTTQIDDDYRKAEKDRELKIKELRHPKYKPLKEYLPGGAGSGTNGTTALPGTITSGNGPGVTTH